MRSPGLGLLPVAALGVVALAPVNARAHNVFDELTLGGTQATPNNPHSAYLSDRVGGGYDFTDDFTLRLDATWTYYASSPAPPGANFATKSANVFLFDLGADWDLTSHWSLTLDGIFSPKSQSVSDTQIAYAVNSQTETLDGQLTSESLSAGGTAIVGYDTAGDSNWETSGDATVGVTYFDTSEDLTKLWSTKRNAPESTANLMTYCMMTHKCPAQLVADLGPHSASLVEVKLGASLTETIHQDSDVGLAGAYYVYNTDPTSVGYFTTVSAGKRVTSSSSFGGGLPIAPWLWTAAPMLTHRFGAFSTTLTLQFGEYVSDDQFSYDVMGALKLQYKIGRTWRLWLKGSVQRDVDSTGTPSVSGFASLGAKARF